MSTTTVVPAVPAGVATVAEEWTSADPPIARHPLWPERFPWLEQGVTGRGSREPFDAGLFGQARVADAQRRWRLLREQTGMPRAVHARQVHGARVLRHESAEAGLFVAGAADGHATDTPGVLLTVSVADCVPVWLVARDAPVVALLHAGWRGVAAGMLEAGIAALERGWQLAPHRLDTHLGPAICGACYEVGAEVGERLGVVATGQIEPLNVDLRAALAHRAIAAGISATNITLSAHCTRCGDGAFFSHRSGDAERQVAFAGIRPPAA